MVLVGWVIMKQLKALARMSFSRHSLHRRDLFRAALTIGWSFSGRGEGKTETRGESLEGDRNKNRVVPALILMLSYPARLPTPNIQFPIGTLCGAESARLATRYA